MVTDFFNRPLKEGDYIFYSTTGRHAESRVGWVVKVGEFYPTIEIIRGNRGSKNEIVSVRNDFVIIEPPVKVGS